MSVENMELLKHQQELEQLNIKLAETEREAQSLTQKIIDADLAKNEFLTSISHDIHNSMNGVIGMLDIVLDEDLSDKARTCLATARSSANTLVAIINDIVDVTSIESGQLEINKEHCCLSEILLDISTNINAQLAPYGRNFEIAFDGQVPQIIYTDPMRVRQCLVNIINSATNCMEGDHCKLTVSSDTDKGGCTIKFIVSDNGIGICPGRREHVMDVLKHADLYSKHLHPNGVDVGLIIAIHLVEIMGGQIETIPIMDNNMLYLGLALPAGIENVRYSTVQELQHIKRMYQNMEQLENLTVSGKILVADDDFIDQKVIRNLLEKTGVNVTIVSDGREVIQKAITSDYDMIFMDINMPNTNGYEAIQVLRSRGVKIPVIALTGHVMKSAIDKCYTMGFDGYLPKPVSRLQLNESLKHYLIDVQNSAAQETTVIS